MSDYKDFILSISSKNNKYLFEEIDFSYTGNTSDKNIKLSEEGSYDKKTLENNFYELLKEESHFTINHRTIAKLRSEELSEDKIKLLKEMHYKDEETLKYYLKRLSFQDNEIDIVTKFSRIIITDAGGLPDHKALTKAGKFLWSKFIPEKIQKKILQKIQETKATGKNLRLRLLIEPSEIPTLQQYPWEALYVEDFKSCGLQSPFLILDDFVSIVHTNKIPKITLALVKTLKVLLIGSYYGNKDYNLDMLLKEDIASSLKNTEEILKNTFRVEKLNIEEVTKENVKHKLQEGWHVIHFLGHGYYLGGDPSNHSGIILKNEVTLTAKEFSEFMQNTITRVVFLASCNTALGFGYGLNKCGIPAVIAMRYNVNKDIIIEASSVFYKSISEKDSIDKAIIKMRKIIKQQNIAEAFTPVLFLSSQDGRLFTSDEKVAIGNYLYYLQRSYSYTPISFGKAYSMDDFVETPLGIEKRKETEREDRKIEKESKNKNLRCYRNSLEGKDSKLDRIDVFDVVKTQKHIVIKGGPGAGKSTLLQYIAYKNAKKLTDNKLEEIEFLPLYLRSNDWSTEKGKFIECFEKSCKDAGLDKKFFETVEQYIKQGKCLILLDGLNEVTKDKSDFINNRLNQFVNGEGKYCNFILTTRSIGYEEKLVGWEEYELMQFDDHHNSEKFKDREKFINVYFGKDKEKANSFVKALKDNKQMRGISCNPLLLKLMCFVYEKNNLILPTRRVDLYDKVISLMLKEYFKLRGNPEQKIESTIRTYRKILEELSLVFFKKGQKAFTFNEIYEILKDNDNLSVIENMPYESGLLQKLNNDKYAFLHPTFQEYFTACALKNQENYIQIVDKNLPEYRRWKKVILFLADLLNEKADELVNLLLNYYQKQSFKCKEKVTKDKWFDLLILALYCCCEKETGCENKFMKLLEDIINNSYSVFRSEAVRYLGCFNSEQTLEMFIKLLKDRDREVRCEAAECLSNIASEKAIDALVNALDENDVYLWEKIASILCELAPEKALEPILKCIEYQSHKDYPGDGLEITEGLMSIAETNTGSDLIIKTFYNRNTSVREKIVEAIDYMTGKNEKITKLILTALHDTDADVRFWAARALNEYLRKNYSGNIPQYFIEHFIKASEDEEIEIRGYIIPLLYNIDHKKGLEALIKAIKYEADMNIKFVTADTCKRGIKTKLLDSFTGKEIINNLNTTEDFLINLFDDKNWLIRIYSIELSSVYTKGSEKVKEKIINALLDDSHWSVRESAAYTLASITPKESIESLLHAMNDEDFQVRSSLAYILGRLCYKKRGIRSLSQLSLLRGSKFTIKPIEALENKTYENVTENLINLLKDEHWQVRKEAVYALKNIGNNKALKPLIELLNDKEVQLRISAIDAIKELGNNKALKPLIELLNDKEVNVRISAIDAIKELGNEIDPFIKTLNDEELEVKINAIKALGETYNEKAVEPLIKILNDKNQEISKVAIEALGKINKSEGILTLLLDRAKNMPGLIETTLGTLRNFEPQLLEKYLDQILPFLKSPDNEIRNITISLLGEIGSYKIIEPLIDMLDDPDNDVRENTREVLSKIFTGKSLFERKYEC